MKILLDENLPKKLTLNFAEHTVFTVREKGWNGKKNGELLREILADRFDVRITFDRNIGYQQNFEKYSVVVVVILAEGNTYSVLSELVPQIKYLLSHPLQSGMIEIK